MLVVRAIFVLFDIALFRSYIFIPLKISFLDPICQKTKIIDFGQIECVSTHFRNLNIKYI